VGKLSHNTSSRMRILSLALRVPSVMMVDIVKSCWYLVVSLISLYTSSSLFSRCSSLNLFKCAPLLISVLHSFMELLGRRRFRKLSKCRLSPAFPIGGKTSCYFLKCNDMKEPLFTSVGQKAVLDLESLHEYRRVFPRQTLQITPDLCVLHSTLRPPKSL